MLKNILIWIAAIFFAIISTSTALGSISKTQAPEIALSLFPKTGFAAQTMASRSAMAAIVENKGNYPDLGNPAWTRMALQAFESEPISPDAIAVVALSHRNDIRSALMRKAFELSRRQKLVNGWLIADSGQRNALSELLHYYDTILRTSPSANAVVMPVMASALADGRSIEPFTELLSETPPWTNRFWNAVTREPQALENAVQLRKAIYEANENAEDYADQNLIKALVREKQFNTAESLYNLLAQESSTSSLVRNGSFSHEPKYPPLDWELLSTGEYGAAIASGGLQISAIAGSGGRFARQLVRLPSDVFQINAESEGKIPSDARMELVLSCAETTANAPIPVRLPLTNQIEQRQINNRASGCTYFWLDIVGRAAENGDGFDVTLNSVSFRPM